MVRSFAVFLLASMFPLGASAHSGSDASDGGGANGIDAAPKQRAAQLLFSDRELITQDGKRVKFYSDVLRDKTVVIDFIFTRCTEACPTQTARLAAAQSMLPDASTRRIAFVSISVDPEHDTAAELKAYAARFGIASGWTFLTGSRDDVHAVLRRIGQLTMSPRSHATLYLLGNVNTGHWMKLHPDSDPRDIASRLRALANEEGAVDRAASH